MSSFGELAADTAGWGWSVGVDGLEPSAVVVGVVVVVPAAAGVAAVFGGSTVGGVDRWSGVAVSYTHLTLPTIYPV